MLKSVKVLQDQGPVRVEIAKLDGKMVVVKQLQIESRELAQRLEREAIVAQKLKHENIVPLLSVQNKALIYEYAPGMSLADLLKVEGNFGSSETMSGLHSTNQVAILLHEPTPRTRVMFRLRVY